MGVYTFQNESTSCIPPARLFKSFILDADNLLNKVASQAITSEVVEGDGGVGTIRKLTYKEGDQTKCVKHKLEAIDKENLSYSYSVIEGEALVDKFDKITYETKLVACDGGSTIKTTITYYTKGDYEVKEENVKAGQQKAAGLLKAVEAYLLANLDAYN